MRPDDDGPPLALVALSVLVAFLLSGCGAAHRAPLIPDYAIAPTPGWGEWEQTEEGRWVRSETGR